MFMTEQLINIRTLSEICAEQNQGVYDALRLPVDKCRAVEYSLSLNKPSVLRIQLSKAQSVQEMQEIAGRLHDAEIIAGDREHVAHAICASTKQEAKIVSAGLKMR
jgi:hypothetical protein